MLSNAKNYGCYIILKTEVYVQGYVIMSEKKQLELCTKTGKAKTNLTEISKHIQSYEEAIDSIHGVYCLFKYTYFYIMW